MLVFMFVFMFVFVFVFVFMFMFVFMFVFIFVFMFVFVFMFMFVFVFMFVSVLFPKSSSVSHFFRSLFLLFLSPNSLVCGLHYILFSQIIDSFRSVLSRLGRVPRSSHRSRYLHLAYHRMLCKVRITSCGRDIDYKNLRRCDNWEGCQEQSEIPLG